MSGDKAPVRFDGVDGKVMIERKLRVALSPTIKDQALRQSQALEEHGLTGRWEVPNELEAKRAQQLMTELGITNLAVRVVEHPNERFNKQLVSAIAAALVYIDSLDDESLHPDAARAVLESVASEIGQMSDDDRAALGRQFKSLVPLYHDLPKAVDLLQNFPDSLKQKS